MFKVLSIYYVLYNKYFGKFMILVEEKIRNFKEKLKL